MLKVKNDNVLILLALWEELKNDLYFQELIEVLEDRQELLVAKKNSTELVDFREYDAVRMRKISNV